MISRISSTSRPVRLLSPLLRKIRRSHVSHLNRSNQRTQLELKARNRSPNHRYKLICRSTSTKERIPAGWPQTGIANSLKGQTQHRRIHQSMDSSRELLLNKDLGVDSPPTTLFIKKKATVVELSLIHMLKAGSIPRYPRRQLVLNRCGNRNQRINTIFRVRVYDKKHRLKFTHMRKTPLFRRLSLVYWTKISAQSAMTYKISTSRDSQSLQLHWSSATNSLVPGWKPCRKQFTTKVWKEWRNCFMRQFWTYRTFTTKKG